MSRDDEIGVAVGLLLKKEKMQAVLWVKSALEMASATRTELLARHEEQEAQRSTDASISVPGEDGEEGGALLGELEKQNESPVERFQPFELAYRGNDELRTDASLLPELKLLCRLIGLESNEDELVNWRWSVPKEILPHHLDEKVDAIERFIREPLDTHGRELTALVMRIRKPRVGGEGEGDTLNPADLPSGWDGGQSDSDEDGDYFDRVRANQSVVDGSNAAADGGLLRSSGGKGRSKSTSKKGGSRKQKRRTQQDFINDSDDEFAFAMGDLDKTQGQQRTLPTAPTTRMAAMARTMMRRWKMERLHPPARSLTSKSRKRMASSTRFRRCVLPSKDAARRKLTRRRSPCRTPASARTEGRHEATLPR